MMKLTALCIALGLPMALPAQAHPGLDSMYDRLAAAYRTNDAKAAAAVYQDSAFYLAPGREVLRGRRAILSVFEQILPPSRRGGTSITFKILDRRVSGNLATDVGTFAMGDDAPSGKFMVSAARGADGVWRIVADGYSPVPIGARPAAGAATSASTPADRIELVGEYVSVTPGLVDQRISIAAHEKGIAIFGLGPSPVPLESFARDQFRLVDPGGPQGLTIRFHRNGGRIVAAVISGESRSAPMFFFIR